MSACEHSKQYYLDFAGQPRAFSACLLCERDSLSSRLDTVTQEREDYRRGWNRSDAQCAELRSRLGRVEELAQRLAETPDATARFYDFLADLETAIRDGNRTPGDPEPAGLLSSVVETHVHKYEDAGACKACECGAVLISRDLLKGTGILP